jgi:hypothetical protein
MKTFREFLEEKEDINEDLITITKFADFPIELRAFIFTWLGVMSSLGIYGFSTSGTFDKFVEWLKSKTGAAPKIIRAIKSAKKTPFVDKKFIDRMINEVRHNPNVINMLKEYKKNPEDKKLYQILDYVHNFATHIRPEIPKLKSIKKELNKGKMK